MDLLNPASHGKLKVREHPTRGVWVDGLSEVYTTGVNEVMDLLKTGEQHRHVAATAMNSASSRSHSVFMITVHQKFKEGTTKTGKLCLADLAGSEKVPPSIQLQHICPYMVIITNEAVKRSLPRSNYSTYVHIW